MHNRPYFEGTLIYLMILLMLESFLNFANRNDAEMSIFVHKSISTCHIIYLGFMSEY